MKWLGSLFRLIYAPPPNPAITALLDEQRLVSAEARSTRERLEARAGDPIDHTLTQMIEDLRQ